MPLMRREIGIAFDAAPTAYFSFQPRVGADAPAPRVGAHDAGPHPRSPRMRRNDLPRPRQARERVKPTQNAGACHLRSFLALGVGASSRLSFFLLTLLSSGLVPGFARLGGEPCCVSDQAGRSLLQQRNGQQQAARWRPPMSYRQISGSIFRTDKF